ncbi:hypothetical protein ZWY2020_040624 [Hordeum vulgare]|nr:hypothetical protein ZWY2020_040624 [Hordeum vulgare]
MLDGSEQGSRLQVGDGAPVPFLVVAALDQGTQETSPCSNEFLRCARRRGGAAELHSGHEGRPGEGAAREVEIPPLVEAAAAAATARGRGTDHGDGQQLGPPDARRHADPGGEGGQRRQLAHRRPRGRATTAPLGEDMDVEKKGGKNYLTWTDEMDEAMLNVFVDHYNRGNRAQNGWKSHVYIAVVNNVRAKCNVDITKENVMSRCKTIGRHHVNVSKMLSTSGFGWDWICNKLMVDSEDVWSKYVKFCSETSVHDTRCCLTNSLHVLQANKYAAFYRHKVIKFWDSISLVFSKDHATGTEARTAAESATEMTLENVNNINIESTATSSTQTSEEQKRKRYRSDDSIASMLGEKLDTFTSAYKADIAQAAPSAKPSSPEEILDALNAIAGLYDDALLEAYDILIAYDGKFNALMVLLERMKKKWILKQINQ